MRKRNFAFTLIEMLTVIAIMAVLMTIIVLPVFQSFNLTRAAEAFSDAQDLARSLTNKVSNEIGNAVSVRGTSGTVPTTLNGSATNLPSSSQVITVPGQNGATVEVVLPWTKLDIIPAGQSGPGTPGSFIDPVTGKVDPTLKAFKGQVSAPVVPSSNLVRYFVALRDPSTPYNDPYSGILMARSGGRDNLYTLYRSIAAPYIYFASGGPTPTKNVNTALFATDANGNIIYDDPRFMVPDVNAGNLVQDNHNLLLFHWLGKAAPWETLNANSVTDNPANFAHSVVVTEVSRYDMIMPQYNVANHQPAYDGNIPRLTPLIQFRPTVMGNDPAAGQEAVRPGEETDNAIAIGPDVLKTQYGLWNDAVVRNYLAGYSPNGNNTYQIGFVEKGYAAPGFSIFMYNPTMGSEFGSNDIELFDDFSYDNAVPLAVSGTSGAVYPFTEAVDQANGRSGWLSNAQAHAIFSPYHLLPGTGKIITSFDISEVGHQALNDVAYEDPNRPNLPTVTLINTPPLTPVTDTNTTAVWSGPNYDINTAFDVAYNQHAYLQPNVQRFIDLRVTANEDGTPSPLLPVTVGTNDATNFMSSITQSDGSTLLRNRARIVPGTETVTGPDENAGDHFGHPIRYTRITTGEPGPNQYKINYSDMPEPSINGVVSASSYQAALNIPAGDLGTFNINTYDPTNFVSATLQPRYKVGYIQLDSDPNLPIPAGFGGTVVPIKVDYRFQLNGSAQPGTTAAGTASTDTYSVDYDTRQLMQVLLTIRNYPQSNLPNPQTVTLKATATLKNVIR